MFARARSRRERRVDRGRAAALGREREGGEPDAPPGILVPPMPNEAPARLSPRWLAASLVLCASPALAASGCAADDGAAWGDEPLREGAAPIVNGETDAGHPAVVALTYGGQAFCSGTLVSPTVVVTAAHCLHPDMTGGIPIGDMQVFFGTDVGAGTGTFIDVLDGLYDASWYLDDPQADDDVGVMRLATPAPVDPLPMGELPPAGTSITLVGFGITQEGGDGGGVKRVATSSIDQIGGKIFTMDVAPQGTCNGDSGGTALAVVGGVETFVGIHTRSDCANIMIDERVDVHRDDFILPFVGEPGCGADGACAAGCPAPDPDCPCAADGLCTAACANPADDVDCDPQCAAGNDCATDCPVPDLDCPTCVPDGVCEELCEADPDCADGPGAGGAGGGAGGGDPGAGGDAIGGAGGDTGGEPDRASAAGDEGDCAVATPGAAGRARAWALVAFVAFGALGRRRLVGRQRTNGVPAAPRAS
jgi:hypothetical protein